MTKTYKDKERYQEKKLKFPRGPYRSSWDQVHEPATRHKRSTSKSIIEQDLEDFKDLEYEEAYFYEDYPEDRLTLKVDYLKGKLSTVKNSTIYILQKNLDNSWEDVTNDKHFYGEISVELINKFESNHIKNIRFLLNEGKEQVTDCSYIRSWGFKEASVEFSFKEEQWMEVFESVFSWFLDEQKEVNPQWKKLYKVNRWIASKEDFFKELNLGYQQQKKDGKEF